MMTKQERDGARLGMAALDEALTGLGLPPVSHNADFRLAESVVGDLPNVVLDSPGAPPLRFVFGTDLDVWIGPISQVLLMPVAEGAMDLIRQRLQDLLRSTVECRSGRSTMVITLQKPDAKPWLRLKVRAAGLSSGLESSYIPYAQATDA